LYGVHDGERVCFTGLKDAGFGAFRAQDVGTVRDEALAHQRGVARGALEAVVVPVAILERDEPSTTNSGDGFGAGGAALGEEFTEAFGAVGFLVFGGEALTGQRLVAVGASEALAMPRVVLVRHASRRYDLGAFDAASGEFLFVAAAAVDVLLARDERFGADGSLAHEAAEALLVPLSALVLHLLGTGAKDFAASVATSGVHRIVARTAEDLLGFRSELLVDQRDATLVAQEAGLMPMAILVRQILGVDANGAAAVVASVGEDGLVALDAVGMLIAQHVALTRQRLVALPTAEVPQMPILGHGFRVFAALRLFHLLGRIGIGKLLDGGGGARGAIRVGLALLDGHFLHLFHFLVALHRLLVIGHVVIVVLTR